MIYYCKNCENNIGEWDCEQQDYYFISYCLKESNYLSIEYMDCDKCDKFIGIICFNVCEICFGENQIVGEKNLFKWLHEYKKTLNDFKYICKKCNKKKYRAQIWFFEELTFYK